MAVINRLLIVKQFLKFAGMGALATGLQYCILIIIAELTRISPVIASAIGYVVSGAVNYALNYRFTFDSMERHYLAAIRFTAMAGAGLFLNSISMYIAMKIINLHYLIAQIMATGLVLIWNFIGSKVWVFKS